MPNRPNTRDALKRLPIQSADPRLVPQAFHTHTHTRLSQAAEIINLPLQSQTSSRATPHSKFVLREAKLAIANDHVICIPFYKTMHRASAGSVLSTGLFYLLSVRALCYLYIVKRRLTYIDRANMIINKSDRTSGMRPVVAFTVWVMCRRLEIVDSLETFMWLGCENGVMWVVLGAFRRFIAFVFVQWRNDLNAQIFILYNEL